MKSQEMWIWGSHSVMAAVEKYPELCSEVILESIDKNSSLVQLVKEQGLKVSSGGIPKTLREHRHQGVACRLKKFPLQSLGNFLDLENLSGVWAVLDRIQDPRNFGAILRSAAAFGLKGIFVGDKEQSPLSGVVTQASAGNAFKVDIFEVPNLNKVMDRFGEEGAEILGLDMNGDDLRTKKFSPGSTVVWVLGSEGKGLREGLEKRCTQKCSIKMSQDVESLNVSAAATVAFYASYV